MAILNDNEFGMVAVPLRSKTGVIAVTRDIYDENNNLKQSEINNIVLSNLGGTEGGGLSSQVAENTTAIAENTTAIAENTTAIADNTTAIAENTTAIADNAAAIAALSSATRFKGVWNKTTFPQTAYDEEGEGEDVIKNGDIIIFGTTGKEYIWSDDVTSVESGDVPTYKWVELGDVTAERKDINDIKENYASVVISDETITSILNGTYAQRA